MKPDEHLLLLEDAARLFLESHGLEPWFTEDEDQALSDVEYLAQRRKWPVLLTPLDTAGEKPYEEFVAKGERVSTSNLKTVSFVDYLPPADGDAFESLSNSVRQWLSKSSASSLTEEMLRSAIADVEPAFAVTHRSSTKSLDARM